MVCADNTVVIPMHACDRGKSEARGARSPEGAPCEGRFVVHVESSALTSGSGCPGRRTQGRWAYACRALTM